MSSTLIPDTFSRLLERAHCEPAFLMALQADTAGTLRQEGIDFPAWLQFRCIENGEPLFALRLAGMASGELSDRDLDAVAGGYASDDDDPFAKAERMPAGAF